MSNDAKSSVIVHCTERGDLKRYLKKLGKKCSEFYEKHAIYV